MKETSIFWPISYRLLSWFTLAFGTLWFASCGSNATSGGRILSPVETFPSPNKGAPSAPKTLQAKVISANEIHLTWIDTADNEDQYIVERKADTDTGFSVIATLGADTESYEDKQANENMTYEYQVKARNQEGGDSEYSTPFLVSTLLPTAPTALAISNVGAEHIDLTWSNTSSGETHFILKREQVVGELSFNTVEKILPPGIESFSDTGLNEDTTYNYQVQAVNGLGDSDYSNLATETTHLIPPGVARQFDIGNCPEIAPGNTRTCGTEEFGSSKLFCSLDIIWNHPTDYPTGEEITYEICIEEDSLNPDFPPCIMLSEGALAYDYDILMDSNNRDPITTKITLTAIRKNRARGESLVVNNILCGHNLFE